jgi:hypothetical protein
MKQRKKAMRGKTERMSRPDSLPTSPEIYRIRVRGQLDRGTWSQWFDGMTVTVNGSGQTVLTGPVADQAALHGLLTKVRDLGLPLISVHLVGDKEEK